MLLYSSIILLTDTTASEAGTSALGTYAFVGHAKPIKYLFKKGLYMLVITCTITIIGFCYLSEF